MCTKLLDKVSENVGDDNIVEVESIERDSEIKAINSGVTNTID